MNTPRQRFLDCVRRVPGAAPIVSPFLPKPELLEKTLRSLGLPVSQDPVADEIRVARALDYEPMFMIDLHSPLYGPDIDAQPLVDSEAGIQGLIARLQRVGEREPEIRKYYRQWRERIAEDGVIVNGHPQVGWLSGRISQENMFYLALDYPQAYAACAEAIIEANLLVNEIAMQEGIDFMSEGSYGLELISPKWYERWDLAYLPRMAAHTHAKGGLFWYHNCGRTRELIERGYFNRLGVDVIETVSPPPEGNNDLAEARRLLDPAICTKGNLSLILLVKGSADEIEEATRTMVRAVDGYAHIYSTADAVYGETPVENFIAFLRTARDEALRLSG
jgi:hypothetical protein